MTRIVRDGIMSVMPHDAYRRASGRLFVSISEPVAATQWFFGSPLRNRLVSVFHSNEDMMDALLASCYIPVYYETPAVFRGAVVLDGGLTDNLPLSPVHPDRTVTVSPNVLHNAHVRPRDRQYPEWFSLFPTHVEDLNAIRQVLCSHSWARRAVFTRVVCLFSCVHVIE